MTQATSTNPPPETDNTHERLLHAAGEVFAERGFAAATIREICRRAGANVAAVNYHFRDKEELYQQVVQRSHGAATGDLAATVAATEHLPPKAKLHAYIHSFLTRLLDTSRPDWQARMMAHEMTAPTAALDVIVRDSIRPQFDRLQTIVAEILKPDAASPPSPDDLRYLSACIMGQILFWKTSQAVICRMYPDVVYDPPHIARIADYLTDFSYSALLARHTQNAIGGQP